MVAKRNEPLRLISVASEFVGKSKFREVYKNPIPEKIKLMEEFFDLLHEETLTGNSNSIKFLKLCKKFNIRKKKITDDIIFFEGPPLETPISFFWRIGRVRVPGKPETYNYPVDPLILEAPHEGKDNTARTATRVFERTRAKILLMNAVHPKIGKKNVRCRKNAFNSDGAHCELTLFHRVHVKLYELFPYSFFVQLHGWANNKFLMMCMNAHNNLFTRNHKSGPLLFARAGLITYKERARKLIFMGDRALQVHGYKRPGGFHNTCVQARHLNGGNQCKLGDSDKGKFMHVELGQKLIKKSRFYEHNVKKFCDTLNLTMEDWIDLDYMFDVKEEVKNVKLETIDEHVEMIEGDFYDGVEDCGDDCDSEEAQDGIEPEEIVIEEPDDFVPTEPKVESRFACLKNCLPRK